MRRFLQSRPWRRGNRIFIVCLCVGATLCSWCIASEGETSRLKLIQRAGRIGSDPVATTASCVAFGAASNDCVLLSRMFVPLERVLLSLDGTSMKRARLPWPKGQGYPMAVAAVGPVLVVHTLQPSQLWTCDATWRDGQADTLTWTRIDTPELLMTSEISPLVLQTIDRNSVAVISRNKQWMLIVERDDKRPQKFVAKQLFVDEGALKTVGEKVVTELRDGGVSVSSVPGLGMLMFLVPSVNRPLFYVCSPDANGVFSFRREAGRSDWKLVQAYCEEPEGKPKTGPYKGLHRVQSISCSSDGAHLFAVGLGDVFSVHNLNAMTGELAPLYRCQGGDYEAGQLRPPLFFPEIRYPVMCVAVPKKDAAIVATAAGDLLWFEVDSIAKTVHLRETLKNSLESPLGTRWPAYMQFTPDGKYLIVVSLDSELVVFKVNADL